MLDLPHTAGCLVCGRENPHGLQLELRIDPQTGVVNTIFTPAEHHIGFTGIAHGGALATVLDEAMVWAATWAGGRFCYCAEMTVRFRQPAAVGRLLTVAASITARRGRLITTVATIHDESKLIAESTGKYVPMPAEQNAAVLKTLVEDASTEAARVQLRRNSR